MGQTAARALDYARETAADALGVRTGDIVFTSGGTESNNLAIKGLALANPRGRHLVHSAIEHASVARVLRLPGPAPRIHARRGPGGCRRHRWTRQALAALLREDTTLVSVMAVNNEVGTIQPIADIAAAAHGVGALVHTDAVQAAGWLDVAELAAARGCAEHLRAQARRAQGRRAADGARQAGPGAADPRRRAGTRTPLRHRERRRRRLHRHRLAPGRARPTAEAPANGYGEPHVQTVAEGPEHRRTGSARTLTGHATERVPGIVSFTFPETGGETVLLELERRGVVASSGSACAAGSTEPSPVLLAMGRDAEEAHTAVRLSFTRSVKESEIATAARAVVAAVKAIAGP